VSLRERLFLALLTPEEQITRARTQTRRNASARILIGLAILLLACDTNFDSRSLVRSEPTRIRNAAPDSASRLPQWHLSVAFRVPISNRRDSSGVTSVDDIAIDRQGLIYILDRETKRVGTYNSQGQFARTLPTGETHLQDPIGIAIDSSRRTWIVDAGLRRYLRVDSSGAAQEFARQLEGYSVPWRGGFGKAGRLYDVAPSSSSQPQTLVLYDDNLRVIERAPLPQSDPTKMFNVRRGGFTTTASIPFSGETLWIYDGDRSIWYVNSARYSLFVLNLRGDTLRIVDRDYRYIPVTALQRDSAVHSLHWFERAGGVIERTRIPTQHPAIRAIVLDGNSAVWVVPQSETDRTETEFDIFDLTGRLVAIAKLGRQLVTPPLPRIVGDSLYAVYKDNVGGVDVGVFRITRH
jgi:hypothetical protein